MAKIVVFLGVFAVMWGLLVLVGRIGDFGEVELLLWLVLLVAAEWFALRRLKRTFESA